MIVTAGVVAHYESSCMIASARPTRMPDQERTSVVADLRCEGEGMRWRTRALFHLETVDGTEARSRSRRSATAVHARWAGAA